MGVKFVVKKRYVTLEWPHMCKLPIHVGLIMMILDYHICDPSVENQSHVAENIN